MKPRLLLFLAAMSFAPRAVAQPTPRDPIAAEGAFDDARRLMKAGKYSEACPKLEASQRLDPGVGTLLNLGDCYEKNGQIASAWARFREAASAAVSAGQPEREQVARARAAAVEARLARLTVTVPLESDLAGLEIKRDGVALDRALWGTGVPVDPGKHVIEASAPGKKPWSDGVEVAAGPAVTATMSVPPLADDPEAKAIAAARASAMAPLASPVAPNDAATHAPDASSSWGTQKTVAAITGGLGILGVGVGTAFALSARAAYSEARASCTTAGCGEDARRLGRDAGSTADLATVVLVSGGILLVTGIVVYFTASRSARAAVAASSVVLRF